MKMLVILIPKFVFEVTVYGKGIGANYHLDFVSAERFKGKVQLVFVWGGK